MAKHKPFSYNQGCGIGKKLADSDSGQITCKPHAALMMLLRQNYHVIMISWMCLSIRFRKHSTSFKKKIFKIIFLTVFQIFRDQKSAISDPLPYCDQTSSLSLILETLSPL